MKFKKALVWSLIQNKEHFSLNKEDATIGGITPLLKTLFPGISYPPLSGFYELSKDCIVPVLKKLFPELQFLQAEDIKHGEEVEVVKFLPSDGYEWVSSLEWQATFKRLLTI